jgi:hypothetical protein
MGAKKHNDEPKQVCQNAPKISDQMGAKLNKSLEKEFEMARKLQGKKRFGGPRGAIGS